VPVGDEHDQRLLRVVREQEGRYVTTDLGSVRFVPLIGAEGWKD
jgi:protein-L-isoaspartate O-methyltransferase